MPSALATVKRLVARGSYTFADQMHERQRPPIDSDARGYPLPSNFVETMKHYTKMKSVSEITRFGIQAGINCGKSAGNCVHFSVDNFDADACKNAVKQLAEGDLLLPAIVGYPPKAE